MWKCRRIVTRSVIILLTWATWTLLGSATDETEPARQAQVDIDKVFSAAVNCSDCIRLLGAAWCPDVDNARCGSPSLECEAKLINPKSGFTIQKNELPSDANQFSVQHVSVQLREETTVKVSFKQMAQYPVDLYFLSDRSESMADDLKKTKELGGALRQQLQELSKKARIGIGVFVDKPVPPFFPNYNPSDKSGQPSHGLSFSNVLPLTDQLSEFSRVLGEIDTMGNLDSPEGGFDALMQAIVCQDLIGWSKDALRILVYVSDALFHHAGDGKLAGIVKPNDGKCHLENGYYTKSIEQDYPSVSHIAFKAAEHRMNLLFAVTEPVMDHYTALSQRIDSSSVHQLTSDSSNVVDVVIQQYRNIVSTLKLTYTSSKYTELIFYTNCTGVWKQSNECDDVKINDVIDFEIHIRRKQCPPRDFEERIQVSPEGRVDTILIDVTHLCDCDCDHPTSSTVDTECSNQGHLICGKCKCNDGFIGEKCECDQKSYDIDQTSNCRPPNTTELCHGWGNCLCNQCHCQPGYSGKFCDCSSITCDHSGEGICGGPERGECHCGTCQCRQGWSGDACDCPTSKEACMDPETGLECSGHGTCNCGVCTCDNSEEGRYTGDHCDSCLTCNSQCEDFEGCVKCTVFESGPLFDDGTCVEACKDLNITVVDDIEDDDVASKLCNINDEANCRIKFRVLSVRGKVYIRVKEEKICPPPINILNIVLTLIAAIVVVGMAILMLWKLLTVIHDRREYAKWDSERKAAKWETGENPIYKQATSTYRNPAFGR